MTAIRTAASNLLPAAAGRGPLNRCSAFTLIELLVVVAIVAILAGLLMPVLAMAKKAASNLRCQSSLGQLGMAATTYASDNSGILPPQYAYASNGTTGVHWYYLLGPLVGMPADGVDGSFTTSGTLYTQRSVVWGCPVWLHRDWKKYWPTSNLTKPSYGMNSNPWLSDSWNGTNWVNSPANSRNLFMASVSLRSQRMLYGDAIDWHLAVNATKTAFADTNNGIRHEGRANYVFFDGHVASLMPAVAVNAIGNPGAVP